MPDNKLNINILQNKTCGATLHGVLTGEVPFEVEYFFDGKGNYIVVQPMLISNIIVFLVAFPSGEETPMALVFNARNKWSDIEKEPTAMTGAIGSAIEKYFSEQHLTCSVLQPEDILSADDLEQLLSPKDLLSRLN